MKKISFFLSFILSSKMIAIPYVVFCVHNQGLDSDGNGLHRLFTVIRSTLKDSGLLTVEHDGNDITPSLELHNRLLELFIDPLERSIYSWPAGKFYSFGYDERKSRGILIVFVTGPFTERFEIIPGSPPSSPVVQAGTEPTTESEAISLAMVASFNKASLIGSLKDIICHWLDDPWAGPIEIDQYKTFLQTLLGKFSYNDLDKSLPIEKIDVGPDEPVS